MNNTKWNKGIKVNHLKSPQLTSSIIDQIKDLRYVLKHNLSMQEQLDFKEKMRKKRCPEEIGLEKQRQMI